MGLVTPHVHADLAAYAERRLSAQRRAQVEAHLAECRACRAAAADTLALVEALTAVPAALRPVERGVGRHWPEVWAKVSASNPSRAAGRLPRALPRLSFYVSLMAVAFSAATLLPGTFGFHPAVTAGVVETPVALVLTPRAAQHGQVEPLSLAAVPVSTDATRAVTMDAAATPAGPAPAPTPKTGP